MTAPGNDGWPARSRPVSAGTRCGRVRCARRSPGLSPSPLKTQVYDPGAETHVTVAGRVPTIHNRVMHNGVMHSKTSGTELVVVLEHLAAIIRQVSTAGGLSTAASSLLHRLGRDEPHGLTELAHAQRISQPGMTQLVTRMEREGLVSRTANSADRRAVLVEATDAGLDLLRRRRAERAAALQHMLGRLAPQDQAAIAAALPALARLVQARVSD